MVNKNQLQVEDLSKGIAFLRASGIGEPTQGAEALLGELEQGKEIFLFIVRGFKSYQNRLSHCDALLIYTGFSSFREKDPEAYVTKQPSLAIEAAQYLVDNFNIRAYGIDTIGIENIPQAKVYYPTPFPVHKVLLLRKKKKAYLIEDMNFKLLLGKNLKQLFVILPRISGIEAMPVPTFAEVED
jgi:kynurenine formamidase